MADLSGMSDADLAAVASGDMSKVSDAGLALLTGAPAAVAPTKPPEDQHHNVASMRDWARQLGLTARHTIEGAGEAVEPFVSPFRAMTNIAANAVGLPQAASTGQMGVTLSNALGLPTPQGKLENIVASGTKAMAGAGGFAGVASKGAQAVTGPLSEALTSLASAPVQQLTGAAGAGAAGETAKLNGAGAAGQVVSALGGGLAGVAAPSVLGALTRGAQAAGRGIASEFGMGPTTADIDAQISKLLQNSGVDYSVIPERIKQGLRADMSSALNTNGPLNPEAISALLDYRTVGATPTLGGITQNPIQITKEMNLAKTGANSADEGLHGMALTQNQNNKTLVRNLNEAGAQQGNIFNAGETAINDIAAKDAQLAANVKALYEKAQSMPGGDIQLDRSPFVNNIYAALAKENKTSYLPPEISAMLDQISAGQITKNGQVHAVPFDPMALDNMLTDIAAAQRSTQDGNVKRALTLARKAIDETPLTPVKPEFGGNAMATAGDAAKMQQFDAMPQAAMDAMNEARAASKARFVWQESSKPIEAALGGMPPDRFIQTHVLSPTATVADVKSLMAHTDQDQVKNAVVAYLKNKALNNAEDVVGKFSQSGYNTALKGLGDNKLAAIFNPQELAHLKAVGRASSYMQVQPTGSAVNNSNSAAVMLGKGYDALKGIIGMIPLGGHVGAGAMDLVLGNPTKNAANWANQRAAMNVGPGLITPAAPSSGLAPYVLPAAAAAGSLTP